MQLANKFYFYSCLAIFFLLSLFSFLRYPGSFETLCLFNCIYLALILLIFAKPLSYGYRFLAIFLFLGFWLKFTAHMIVKYDFVEPIGHFDFMPDSWDKALYVASFAALGVVIVRVCHILMRYFLGKSVQVARAAKVPPWFENHSKTVWFLSIFFSLLVHLMNYKYSFYKTGMHPALTLPFKLHVLISWLVFLGISMWFSMLINWEVLRRTKTTALPIFLPIGEGFFAAVSMASRAAYIFHTLPYLFVLCGEKWNYLKKISAFKKGLGVFLLLAMFALSLLLISWYRLSHYTVESIVEIQGPITLSAMTAMARQVAMLFIDRWIGLEAVLAVSSWPDTGLNLFLIGVLEDPANGVQSLYQNISNSPYQALEGMTFLTLPGIVAVLFYSGSMFFVFLGMSTLYTFVLVVETLVSRLLRNSFLTAIVCLGLGNALCQMNFPYLFAVFFAELIFTFLVLYAIQGPLYK